MNNTVMIVAARRTPLGSFQGQFASLSTTDLGAVPVRAVVEDAAIDKGIIDEVILGCVLQAGIGQAPARQAVRKAGLPDSIPCTTVNKVCGSGMKAVTLGCDVIRAGTADVILAGGMESMSNAPYLLHGARAGYRSGHQQVLDHMIHDGLQNVDDGEVMGFFAEQCADRYRFKRKEQDTYAARSVRRAREAMYDGAFAEEICPVSVVEAKGKKSLVDDEQPLRCKPEKIAELKPVFRPEGGTVTAASSAAISDGAAAVLLVSESQTAGLGLLPLARVVAHTTYAGAPADFTTAPGLAIQRLYKKTGWRDSDVDLYEINEAFAVVVLAAMADLGLDPARVNVNGGACALGHPIGATGARLIVSLVHALRRRSLRRGIAALCIGGGEATAVAVDVLRP